MLRPCGLPYLGDAGGFVERSTWNTHGVSSNRDFSYPAERNGEAYTIPFTTTHCVLAHSACQCRYEWQRCISNHQTYVFQWLHAVTTYWSWLWIHKLDAGSLSSDVCRLSALKELNIQGGQLTGESAWYYTDIELLFGAWPIHVNTQLPTYILCTASGYSPQPQTNIQSTHSADVLTGKHMHIRAGPSKERTKFALDP